MDCEVFEIGETEDVNVVKTGTEKIIENVKNSSENEEMNAEDLEDYRFECLYCDFKTLDHRRWTTHVNYLHRLPEMAIDPDEEGKNVNSEKTQDSEDMELNPHDNKITNEFEYVQSDENGTENVADTDLADRNVEESEEKEIANFSKSPGKFCCKYCSYKCDRKDGMEKHFLCMHTNSKRKNCFYCDACNFMGKTRLSLIQHVKQIHFGYAKWKFCPFFTCDLCFFKTRYKYKLLSHKKLHLCKDEWIMCELCEFKSKSKVYYDNHYLVNHAADDETLWFKCDLCPFQHKIRTHIRNHMLSIHRLAKSVIDSYISAGKKSQEVDFEKRHCFKFGTKENNSRKVLICTFCNDVAMSCNKILEHIAVHHNLVNLV